jgi:dTDP-L-rhamnose 4-epimerase
MPWSCKKVLVTGGAGFIGSHTVDALVDQGCEVTLLDSLELPSHRTREFPNYLNRNCRKVKGSILQRSLVEKLCKDADAVIHLAALVGGYQSMYQIDRYVETNTRGTSVLLDILVNTENAVRKLIVASSMMVYGEGTYKCGSCGTVHYPATRDPVSLRQAIWDPRCAVCGTTMTPVPTKESRPRVPGSIYAASKGHQEEISLLVGKTQGIRTTVLRYFNVYGSRQSLSNPYTGVCAVFTSRILNKKPPVLFEDGMMLRDFVHVSDVARANLLALQSQSADYEVFNIGSGIPTSILDLARTLTRIYGSTVEPQVSLRYRTNDIRQCYADISKAKDMLGFTPMMSLENGLMELAEWAKANRWDAIDLFQDAMNELSERKVLF